MHSTQSMDLAGAIKWKDQEIMEVFVEQLLTVSNLFFLGNVLHIWM